MSDIDLAGMLAEQMTSNGGPIGVRPMTLVKLTAGTRTGGSISGGNNPIATSYPCSGRVEDYSSYDFANSLVKVGARKVSIFGGSLPSGVVPDPNDQIVDSKDGATYRIAMPGGVKDGSGVGAIYECQCLK